MGFRAIDSILARLLPDLVLSKSSDILRQPWTRLDPSVVAPRKAHFSSSIFVIKL